MCVRLLIAVFTISLICLSNAQSSLDYHEDSDSVRDSERELQPVGETERELHQQERLRLAALEAELREELKVAQHAKSEEDGVGAIPGRPGQEDGLGAIPGRPGEEDGLGAIPGRPGQDYPVFTSVPRTSFSCADKLLPGYYADVQALCQVFHICDASGAKHSFLCPRGSLFNQKYLVCDWWYTSECDPADGLVYQHDFNRLDHNKEPDLPDNQYYSNAEESYILLQSDIFDHAETGVPNREKYESSKDVSKSDDRVKTSGEDKNSTGKDISVGNSTKPEIIAKSTQRKQSQEKDRGRDYF